MREALLERVHTEPLRRAGVPTVALVVVNAGESDAPPCRVRFSAAFVVREIAPVTVRDDAGNIVPSRIVDEARTPHPNGVLWSLMLEFAVGGVPARSAKTFAAGYEASNCLPLSETIPFRDDLMVYETGLHTGDLPLAFALPPT